MKTRPFSKIMAMLLVVVMLACSLPISVLAAKVYDESNGGSTYYNVISERQWDLAPGIKEYEHVLNNDDGTRRQVLHTATVDLTNPYTKVIAGYKGMWPEEGNLGVQSTSVQALEAEQLGVGNVVVATNTTLSWYTHQYYKDNPHLIGEPLGYTILDGELYVNSSWTFDEKTQKFTKHAADSTKTVIIINYDKNPITGQDRSETDIPKVWIRSTTDPLTGWEEQAIPVSFDFLVKPDANGNPVNQYKSENHTSDIASRTFVGVKADGTLVIAVSDGEQAPYSAGFTPYEMADYMIKMGCVVAANCDGGGSTTFCSQRPGEDLKVNCSLSDGGERPTTSTILVITTAPADGTFARANLSTDFEYYTPGSSVTFNALGTDAVGTKVDIPADVQWQLDNPAMGTISNGVFKSNGTEGTVTAQMIYEGKVVGEKTITIVTPDTLSFAQPIVTIPFGKTAKVPVKATANINGVAFEIGLGENDITFVTDNAALGSFVGLNFVAVDEANSPTDVTSTVTATLNIGNKPSASVQLNLGKASEILWDFEGGQADIDIWNVVNNRKNAAHWDYYLNLSLADRTNGQVHDGNYSMRLETNGLSSKDSHAEQYAWIRLGVDGEAITLENARRVGFWMYVPEDNVQCMVQGHYMTDLNGDGVFETENIVSMMEQEDVYYKFDESGWHYLSMDISAFEQVALKAAQKYDKDPSDGMKGETGEFFLALIFHKATNNLLWSENGSINGNYTYYLDSFTVDYSEAVDDRESPIFDKIYLDGTALIKRDFVTTANNILTLTAAVADKTTLADAMGVEQPLYNVSGLDADTAKVYIDGVEVNCTFANGVMTASGIKVADGYHRVKFEICDNAGNKSSIVRVIKVESGEDASTVKLVPADPTLDRILFGSVYWMNLEATAIETIQSVEAVIDLNNVNHWELDHMELADDFTASYTINEETNTATIKIVRTAINDVTGAAVLAKLPVRILYFDTDIHTPGYTAATYWTSYPFWPQDMKMDVDMGIITFTDDTTGTFSNEEFHVDTEMFTDRPHMAQVDFEYLNNHGTTHVHTPVAMTDLAPTCTATGYTGRTFCHGCNSVVDWGTTYGTISHAYSVNPITRKIICFFCNKENGGTGLQTIGGRNYYLVAGKLQSGWFTVEDEWYYFDAKTYAGADGEQFADKGVKFSFENGRLLSGTWVTTSEGSRYWYGPGYYRDMSPELTSSRPYEIDGKTYLFDRYGYMKTGIARYYDSSSVGGALASGTFIYYDCGNDGVAARYTGVYDDYFHIDGIRQKTYMLVQDTEGNFYFINDGHKIAKNVTLYLSDKFVAGHTFADGTPIPAGRYQFDAEGKMVIVNTDPPAPPVTPEEPDTPDNPPADVKNGVINGFLYINDVKQSRYKLVEYAGDFYFINDGDKIAKNMRLYLSDRFVSGMVLPDGRALLPGYYNFDAEGKMIIEPLKNGVVGEYLYINDVKQTRYKLVEFEGDFYFINDGDKIAKNTRLYLSATYVNGKVLPDGRALLPGYYNFDAEGKMIIEPLKNGVVGDYLYINDIKQTRYKLVEFEGDFYFINDGDKIAKNTRLYLSATYVNGKVLPDGRALLPGYYNFDAEGKMIIEPLKNGVVGDYLYINDVKQTRYKLVEFEGYFYFINDGDKIAKNVRLYLSEMFVKDSPLAAGYYRFDANGKLIAE